MRRLRWLPSTLVAVAAGLTLAACSGGAPEILFPDTTVSLVLNPATGEIAEVLRLFVAVRDPDGPDDPARIFVIHDESRLYWEITPETWVHLEYGGDDWYGVPQLRLPDGEDLPRGRYRLIVEDSALSRDEAEFFLTRDPGDRTAGFPRLATSTTAPRIVADAPVAVRAYGRGGQLIVERVVAPGALPPDLLSRIPAETGVEIFLFTTDDAPRRQTGPYPAP